MSERCLLKIRFTILPPPLVLSKALVKDMKESLLIEMDKLLSRGMKVQAIAAWGWFIRILGSHSMKNRSLVNYMLKIPERTFSDHDPQVQIASQVAWEGVIDALVHTPNLPCEINLVKENDSNQTVQLLNENNCEIKANAFSKSLKLIMVPLVGVMLSKCDISVRLSCLNTWHYLLYKLDSFVNSPSVIKLVVEPVLEAIFQLVPDNENLRLWTMCLSFLDDFLLAKCSQMDNDVTGHLCYKSETVTPNIEYSETGKRSWKQCPIRWLPWNLNHLDFHLKMICVITSSASMETFNNENRTFAYDACQSLVAVWSTSTMHLTDCILKEMCRYFELVFSSFIPPDNLLAAATLVLYKNIVPSNLKIWIEVAKGLMESSTMGNHLALKTKSETEGVDTICHILSYPFVVCSSKELCGSPLEGLELASVVQVWKSLYGSVNTLQLDSFVSISFTEGLASMLNGCLDDQRMPGCGSESCSSCEDFIADFFSIFVNIVTNLLNGLQISKRRSYKIMRKDSNSEKSSLNNSSLRLAARFIEIVWIKKGKNSSNWLSRVFSALAQFVNCLHLKQDIFEFIEIISSPLLLWLTKMETLDERINSELQILWSKITSHLQNGCPSLVSDSAFLKLLAPLLEKTLDHPNPSISERTITFWSSSFGEHLFASYPQNLLPILHKLSRNGRIKLQKRCLWVIEQCPARQEENADPPFSHRVSATSIKSSKRIQIMTTTNHDKHKEDTPTSNPKRKKIKLTQHQKEVRRAQQGRSRDCGGHGPGIRTYTSLDFSQVVDDSEESQDTQNLDSILEMARADN
uniref:Telomere-associated protein Rif1 N-terminal domain-containing protein n=1 Tax=Cucumis sativus TaxID=3659 RepID=A0A0A0LTL9_CUCSA